MLPINVRYLIIVPAPNVVTILICYISLLMYTTCIFNLVHSERESISLIACFRGIVELQKLHSLSRMGTKSCYQWLHMLAGGSWSYIGTDAATIPKESFTMNLGFVDRSTILHEFGHSIGLIHEHQSPFKGGFEWNKDEVSLCYNIQCSP